MAISVDTSVFNANVRRYAGIAGKSIGDAVKEEAKLVAGRLVAETPPKTGKIGKGIVERDISRVFLGADWFLEKFNFRSPTLGEKIKEAVRSNDQPELEQIFQNSDKFRRIHIEDLDAAKLNRVRKRGRVPKKYAPFSFPLADQPALADLVKAKQAQAGTVKAGWAACVRSLGGSAAGWMKGSNGRVVVDEQGKTVTLINSVSYAAAFDGRGGFSRLVLSGRDAALQKKMQVALDNIRFNR